MLVLELAATRALAPFFGQALFVWTNVIGLVLAGLALGSIAGGRFADRHPSLHPLAYLLSLGAALTAVSAYLPGPIARLLLPEELPLDASYEFLLRGSFVTTLFCFFPAVFLLGAVPPYLVRCFATGTRSLGSTSGLLYGGSTLGSIAGTFLTSYVLLPRCGVRGSLLLAAGFLAASAVPMFLAAGGTRRSALAAVVTGAWLTWALASDPPPLKGAAWGTPVAVADSSYQHIEILHREDLGARALALDEGHDSYQSLLPDEGYLTGRYYDYFAPLLYALPEGRPLKVLMLGLAGGTQARQLLHYFGDRDLTIVGVELDPEVVRLCAEHLDLPQDERLRIVSGVDARVFLNHSADLFDWILVDCYSHQSYVPFHLASVEFFRSCRDHLLEHGILSANLSGYGARDPVIESLANTMAQVFPGGVQVAWIPQTINFLVYARRTGRAPSPRELLPLIPLSSELRPLVGELAAPIRSWLLPFDPGRPLLTDDTASIERLQEERLRDFASRILQGAGTGGSAP